MRSADQIPPGALRPADLDELFDHDGPFLSVYMNTEGAVERAAQRDTLRWRELRDAALEAGASEALVSAVDPLVEDAHLHGRALAVIAAGARALHVEHLAWPVRTELARVAPLPSIAPLVEARQGRVRHVIAVVDRRGADLMVMDGTDTEVAETVEPALATIRKVQAGGWSQPRYQHRAEQRWDDAASDIAGELARLVDVHNPRLVLLAGDVRMLELLQKALPDRVAARARTISGTRAADGSDDAHHHDVIRMAATAVAEDTVALLRRFEEERGQHDLAVDGVDATLRALSEGRVEVLLAHDEPGDERTAWFGAERAQVANDAEALTSLGIREPREGRLVDVAMRAAFGTGAGARVVPAHGPVADGIGALLRWS